MRSRLVRIVLLLAAGSAVFFAGRYMARASLGGPTTSGLSFAGTLRQNGQPMTGNQMLDFAFHNGYDADCDVTVMVTPDSSTGSFETSLPLDGCTPAFFNGISVTFDVSVGGTTVVSAQPVTAVPYAKFADQVGMSDCPLTYERDKTVTAFVLCKNGPDEMVKVGTGPQAFWIDRYEASVWDSYDSGATQYTTSYPSTFPANGQTTSDKLLVTLSESGDTPSSNISWYQANVACIASGKRLPSRQEWLMAAAATPNPGSSAGTGGLCVTNATGPRNNGGGTACVSTWGAQDMIGNLSEWTGDDPLGVRGGNYTSSTAASAIELGAVTDLGTGASTIGFRCATIR
jgi:hypothetical protein